MKYPIAVLAMVAVFLISSTAVANGEERTEFYDFETCLGPPRVVVPDGLVLDADRPEFKPHVQLPTSFLPEIEESAEQLRILD